MNPRISISMHCQRAQTVTAAIVLAFAAGGCARSGRSPSQGSDVGRPNILLITVDTLRPDHLSIYGFQERATPHIDELGRQGAVFDAAYCDVTWTTPSVASTLTGLYPTRHGLRSNFDRLPDDVETVAELLATHGYRNAAVVGSYPLDSIRGLDQGFEVYDDEFTVPLVLSDAETWKDVPSRRGRTFQEQRELNREKALGKSRRTDEEVTGAAIARLEELGATQPFFLWVHYFGPHSLPDTREDGPTGLRRHVDTYADKVLRTDEEVGRLLGHLGKKELAADALVIFHSDHGEALGEHEVIGHGRFLYEDNLRIPLIIRWPGRIPAGGRVGVLVGNIDIAATILDAAGVPVSESLLDGRSVLPAILEGSPIRTDLYLETYLSAHRAFAKTAKLDNGETAKVGVRRLGVFRPPYKLVVTQPHPLFDDPDVAVSDAVASRINRRQVFNVEADPGEMEDLARRNPETSLRLEELLESYLQQSVLRADAQLEEISEEHIEKLRSLGYLE